jgi:hypothetical protein
MSTIKVDTLVASDGTSPVTLTKQEAPKFVVRFTADTTTAVVGSPLNSSSITDNGVGYTTLGISSSMNDALYVIQTTNTNNKSSSGVSVTGPYGTSWTNSASSLTTSSAVVSQRFASPAATSDTDMDVTCVLLIGDLA